MSILLFKKEDVQKVLSVLKPSDTVTLVGDHGIYLMGFNDPTPAGQTRTVAYAEGCNPSINEDFYDNKRDLYGGDDGSDDLDTVEKLQHILSKCEKHLKIKLTKTSISMILG